MPEATGSHGGQAAGVRQTDRRHCRNLTATFLLILQPNGTTCPRLITVTIFFKCNMVKFGATPTPSKIEKSPRYNNSLDLTTYKIHYTAT
jgi:hypothetical protein